MKQTNKIAGEKTVVIAVLITVLIIILALVGIKLGLFSGFSVKNIEEESKLSYLSYKQICSKDNSYFQELAEVNETIREVKEKSSFCTTSEKEKVDEDYLDDMNCECLENEIRECKEGWVLEGKYCYKDKLYTSSLKACSFYSCQDNRYVEVVV